MHEIDAAWRQCWNYLMLLHWIPVNVTCILIILNNLWILFISFIIINTQRIWLSKNLITFKFFIFYLFISQAARKLWVCPKIPRDTESWCWAILDNQVRELMPITRDCPLTLREPLWRLPCPPVFVVTSPNPRCEVWPTGRLAICYVSLSM